MALMISERDLDEEEAPEGMGGPVSFPRRSLEEFAAIKGPTRKFVNNEVLRTIRWIEIKLNTPNRYSPSVMTRVYSLLKYMRDEAEQKEQQGDLAESKSD